MTSALSQQVPDAPSTRSALHLQKLLQQKSKPALFIVGSVIVHFGLLFFAAETPAAVDENAEIPSELVVDFTPEETVKEEALPLGKLEEPLIAPPPVAIKAPPLQKHQNSTQSAEQVETTPEILGSEADPTDEHATQAHTFNPYAQQNTDHFTRGNIASRSKKPEAVRTFGIETGSNEASVASGAALKAWYGSIRAQLAAGGLNSYPKRARKLGLSGIVKLAVSLGVDGQLLSVRVQSSSGSPVLDQAALSGVKQVKNLPEPPTGAGATSLIVPIKFSLR